MPPRRRKKSKSPATHSNTKAPSSTPSPSAWYFTQRISWFFRYPLRRSVLLILYLFELIIVPFRKIGCCSRNWNAKHAESVAIDVYIAYQETKSTAQEKERLQLLFDTHTKHRSSLLTILPELWNWFPAGRMVYDMSIVPALRNKLALLDYFYQDEDVDMDMDMDINTTQTKKKSKGSTDLKDLINVEIPPTIWIVGLPRTGSTYFHSLLALDEEHIQTYKQWELRAPVASRAARRSPETKDFRQKKAEAAEWLYRIIFAPLLNIHYVTSNQVDECVQGFVEGTLSEYYLWGCCKMPNAYDWYVNQTDAKTQYEFFKRSIAVPFAKDFLLEKGLEQEQERINNVDAIVLKAPHHSVKLCTIADVFDTPVFVWLHRNLDNVVGSTCSMNGTINDCISSSCETKTCLGARTLNALAMSMNKAVDDRQKIEAQQNHITFVDIFHTELRSDPVNAVKQVYAASNINISETFIEKINIDTQERNEKRKQSQQKKKNGSQHHYNLAEFGLTSEDVEVAFKKYIDMREKIKKKQRNTKSQRHGD